MWARMGRTGPTHHGSGFLSSDGVIPGGRRSAELPVLRHIGVGWVGCEVCEWRRVWTGSPSILILRWVRAVWSWMGGPGVHWRTITGSSTGLVACRWSVVDRLRWLCVNFPKLVK